VISLIIILIMIIFYQKMLMIGTILHQYSFKLNYLKHHFRKNNIQILYCIINILY